MRNFSGKYFSTNHFVNACDLGREAKKVLGKGWTAEEDTAQIQRILDYVHKNNYVVTTNEANENYDWITVSENGTPTATYYTKELACDIARLMIEDKFENTSETISEEDEEGCYRYTPFIQEEFDRMYNKIEALLLTNKI